MTMKYQQIIEKLQLCQSCEEITEVLSEVNRADKTENSYMKVLQDKITQELDHYKPENNYGFQPSTIVVNGAMLSLSNVKDNLRYAIEWINNTTNQPATKQTTMQFKEADLPDFLTDDNLINLLNYTKSTISTKRSRGELPQTNNLGLTSKKELFKMLESSTPSYLTPDQKVQQLVNKKKKS